MLNFQLLSHSSCAIKIFPKHICEEKFFSAHLSEPRGFAVQKEHSGYMCMLTKTKFQCAQINKTIGHFNAQFFDTVRSWSLPIFSDFVLNMKEDGVGFTEELIAIERVLTQFIQLAIMLFLQTLSLGVTKKCVYKKLYECRNNCCNTESFPPEIHF